MLITIQKRTNITVDDRRVVFAAARSRKSKDVAAVSNEVFIGNALRDRMNWSPRDENTEALVTVAKQMAAFIDLEFKAAAEKAKAKEAAIKVLRDADLMRDSNGDHHLVATA